MAPNKSFIMLELQEVNKIISGSYILKNVDLKMKTGDIVALIGESGSGKTTLLNIIALLSSVTSGSIYLDGVNCTNISDNERNAMRKNIGFIHQFHHLLPEFTVLENLIIPQIISNVSYSTALERAKKLLSRFGLEELFPRKTHQLSGGQNQRIAILRAFINSPKIVLADEPTGNLDKKNAEEIFHFILESAHETGTTILVVTHNQELAQLTDRIINMNDITEYA